MADDGQYDSQINLEQEEYEQETTIEQEDSELEITMQPEAATVYGGSVVNSINGQVGDVILTTSDLENTSDYQTGAQVQSAIAGKQDKLTAGTNIQINNDVISATDTTYSAGSGLNLDGNTFSVDTNTIATVQDVTNEATTRENSDANLQGQIDALTVSSDVIDVLGTYQDLQNYDTSHVKANDIIKVLQDNTHNNAMSYYRWTIVGNVGSWVYVGSEGPYYTKNEADTLLNTKQNITDNSLETNNKTVPGAINEVNSIAKGANQALSFANYSTMVTEFNSLGSDEYNVGQNIYIQTVDVPDLWISDVESTSFTYTYVDDATIISALDTNGYIQVGYYKLSALETQKVDLTDYVKNTDYATSTIGGVIKTYGDYGSALNGNGRLYAITKTYAQYGSASDALIIGKGTLENVIEGKGLVSNTDYANNTTAGVIRTSSSYGTTVSGSGLINAYTLSYENYNEAANTTFVGKGTLENVITGKGLVSNTDYASGSVGGVVKSSTNYGTQVASSGIFYGSTRTYDQYLAGNNNVIICKGTLENVLDGKGITALSAGDTISISSIDYADLPSDYTQVEYITNPIGDNCKIDTGVGEGVEITFEIDAKMLSVSSSGNSVILGKSSGAGGYYGANNTGYWGAGSTSSTTVSSLQRAAATVTYSSDGNTVSGTVDGESFTRTGTSTTIANVVLGNTTLYTGFTVWSLVGKDSSNNVIFNGVPCKNSQNVYGLYDTVSDTFMPSTTSDNFTGGKEIISDTLINVDSTVLNEIDSKQDTLTAGANINIDNNTIAASGETIYYGVSSSTAGGQAKTVSVDSNFTLRSGVLVRVLFANGQTYNGAPTLNVNSTGAKTIQYKSGTNAMRYIWTSGQVVDFVYNETRDSWIMVMGALASTSYYGITKLASSATSAGTTTALTPYSLNAVMANIITGYPTYSSSSTYAVGDRVRNDWYVYECTTAITTAESWNADHWRTIDPLQTQIDALAARITALENR